MAKQEITLQNFSGGELSPLMFGRYDLAVVGKGCRRLENFIAETEGPARFRSGLKYVLHTRRNNIANLIKFEFNDEQAYQLEFTSGYLRFYKDEGIITETPKTITGISTAAQAVVTSNSHGFSDGDEVFIDSVSGITKLNGRSFLVSDKTANTFKLKDNDGNYISSIGLGTYSSGGTASRIYEIQTPYTEADDLFKIRIAQNADTAYVVHPYYEPRKLTRTGHTSWTLSLFTRTNDPFLDSKTITGATQANPCKITSVGHGYATGDIVIVETVVGMTELNGRYYTITKIDADNFTLDGVDSTAYTAYSSAGYASLRDYLPSTVSFYESRLWYGGTNDALNKFYGSRSPDNTGNPRYDDFTNGTDPDHAVEFAVADEEVNKIRWIKGSERTLFMGTYGSEVKVTGDTAEAAIDPSSVNVRSINRDGVADISPINRGGVLIYVQRGGLTVRSIEFDALSDSYISVDRTLVAGHITVGNIKQLAWQAGRPDIMWAVKENGELLGLTVKAREDVSGWHRHRTRNLADKFLSVSSMPRPSSTDQMWFVVERTINGSTRRYVEFMTDQPVFPVMYDYITDPENEDSDRARYKLVLFESQKEYIHLDSALSYDGTWRGEDAAASLTPAAVSGSSVLFTASSGVFTSADVGNYIRRKSITGNEFGRAKIIGYTSSTQVTCLITEDFDSIEVIPSGEWYLTFSTVSGLEHLEGETVSVVADGAPHPDVVVENGEIDLNYEVSKCHIGFDYHGILQPMVIEVAGLTGPAQTKLKNVYRIGIKFLNSLGCEYGTDFYKPESIPFTEMPIDLGNPIPLFSGVRVIPYSDSWESDKLIYIRQRKPLPCIVQLLAIYAEGDND